MNWNSTIHVLSLSCRCWTLFSSYAMYALRTYTCGYRRKPQKILFGWVNLLRFNALIILNWVKANWFVDWGYFLSPQGQPSWLPDCCGRRSWAERQRWTFLKGSVSGKETKDDCSSWTLSSEHYIKPHLLRLYFLPAGSRCRTGGHTYQWQRGRWTPPGCAVARKRGGGKRSTPG